MNLQRSMQKGAITVRKESPSVRHLAIELDPAFPIYPIYSRDISHLKTMVGRLRDKGFAVDEAEGRNLGPTIGAHIGPGCCGVAFVAAEETGVC